MTGTVICQGCSRELPTWTGACPDCGNTEFIRVEAPHDLMIGRVIANRYKVVSKLGQGGMGSVYIGELVGIGQRVAIKFLNANMSNDPEIARRFLNEAKSYARISHPNAVILHDFGQDEEGTLYISMDLVEGTDLQKLLAKRGRLSIPEAIEISLQLADVLGHAHSKGVVHRDLKPENIMVRQGTRGLHIKVLDFGIARLREEGAARQTAQGSIAGTPRYMAPEQADGQDVDARVDVYSVGLVMFELLTGVQPFDGSSLIEILQKQLVSPMPHLLDVAPDLDYPRLDAVIQRATAKNRTERYQTMQEFAIDLSKAVPTQLGSSPSPAEIAPGVKDSTLVRSPIPRNAQEGFRKTAWTQSPYRPPRSSGLRVVAVILAIAAAAGVYLARKPSPVATPEKPREEQPISATAPPAKEQTVIDLAKETPPPTAAAAIAPDMKWREELLTKEILIKANNEFAIGNISGAKTILSSIPKEHESNPEVVEFRSSLEQISSKLAQARRESSQGDCTAAIKVYQQILKSYPSVREARRGRDECQQMLPPSFAD
jgi:serine/threonine-protein kinase